MLDYTLIRSSRRTLSLGIDRDGYIIVRAPLRYSVDKIEYFIREKSRWIEKNQVKMREKKQREKEEKWYYSLFGDRYERWDRSDEDIIALSKENLRKYIHERLPSLTDWKIFRRNITNIRISSARTRWWSCSSLGNLSFPYRLVAFPKDTIDAVIIHELAHLTHANHSKRFWDLVYTWMPEYKLNIAPLSTGSLSL